MCFGFPKFVSGLKEHLSGENSNNDTPDLANAFPYLPQPSNIPVFHNFDGR